VVYIVLGQMEKGNFGVKSICSDEDWLAGLKVCDINVMLHKSCI
jgi:hypothetical protein